MFIGMKHISITFRYIIPMYLRLTTFAKTLPQMSFHLMCCYLFPLWGSTHNSADCWSAHISPVSRDACPRHLQTCARLMQAGSLRPGPPPPTKILATPVTELQKEQNGMEQERHLLNVNSIQSFRLCLFFFPVIRLLFLLSVINYIYHIYHIYHIHSVHNYTIACFKKYV